jgi:hypothetical protein
MSQGHRRRPGWLRVLRGWLFSASVLASILATVAPVQPLRQALPLLALLSMVAGFPAANRIAQILTVLFVAAGIAAARASDTSTAALVNGFGSMIGLLTLVSVVPVLAVPIQLGGYDARVARLLSRRSVRPRPLYAAIGGLSYLMASLMNIAAVPMMYHTVVCLLRWYVPEPRRFALESIVTCYALPLSWSPVAAVVAVVVHLTGVSWLTILPVMLLTSLAGVAMSTWLSPAPASAAGAGSAGSAGSTGSKCSAGSAPEPAPRSEGGSGSGIDPDRPIWHITLAVLLFILTMLGLERWTGWGMLQVIGVVPIPFALLWSLLIRRGRAFLRALAQQHRQVANLQNLFTVFTAAGFFVQAVSHSPYIAGINHLLIHTALAAGPALFVAILPLIPVALSMVGFHPTVTLTLLSSALHPQVLHLSPIWLSVALLGGGAITFVVSPFTATLNVAAAASGERPSVIMRWNLRFCAVYLAMVMGIAALGQAVAG